MNEIIGVCSNKPRPSTHTNKSYQSKTGESHWGKDVWHIRKSGTSTLCGIDSSEWLNMGKMEIDFHTCDRCKKKQKAGYPAAGGSL